jgi:hypothetical protein
VLVTHLQKLVVLYVRAAEQSIIPVEYQQGILLRKAVLQQALACIRWLHHSYHCNLAGEKEREASCKPLPQTVWLRIEQQHRDQVVCAYRYNARYRADLWQNCDRSNAQRFFQNCDPCVHADFATFDAALKIAMMMFLLHWSLSSVRHLVSVQLHYLHVLQLLAAAYCYIQCTACYCTGHVDSHS